MKSVIQAVLELQPDFFSTNTDGMRRRGIAIRGDGARWLRDKIPMLLPLMPESAQDLAAEGRDGTGQKE